MIVEIIQDQSSLKNWTGPGSNPQPLDLQLDADLWQHYRLGFAAWQLFLVTCTIAVVFKLQTINYYSIDCNTEKKIPFLALRMITHVAE